MQRRERQGTSSPFGLMRRMMEDMDSMFQSVGGGGLGRETPIFNPAIEVLERDGNLVVRADLPGIKKDDVRVHVDEDGLVIEGERNSEQEENRGGYFHSERSYGAFQRRIPLPRGADVSSCDASFDDGVLEVKIALPKESRRSVEIKSRAGQPEQSKTVKH